MPAVRFLEQSNMYLQTISINRRRQTYHCASLTVPLHTLPRHIKIRCGAVTTATYTESKKNFDSGCNKIYVD
jgi:hypothetical protein